MEGDGVGGGGGGGGGISEVREVSELFDLMESSQLSVVNEIKALILEHFNSTKESWLVGGLYDYYIITQSTRCMEILISVSREPHDKYVIDKITEGIRSPLNRKQSLVFFGYLVRRQPSWLYKIFPHLMREIFKIMKTDTDVVVLLTGLLSITTALPIIPANFAPHITEVFDVFGRLAIWLNSAKIAEEHMLHLQVALYSLFHRLYAMYPCNFLSNLRHTFAPNDKRSVFIHKIKPMLETVKMHPLLVCGTKEGELIPNRWTNKEQHDIIAECAKLSLDVLESGLPEEPSTINLRPWLSSGASIDNSNNGNCQGQGQGHGQGHGQHGHVHGASSPPVQTPTPQFAAAAGVPAAAAAHPLTTIKPHQLSSLIQEAMNVETKDLATLASLVDVYASAPPTPLTATTTTAGYVQSSAGPGFSGAQGQGQGLTVSAAKSTASPPEAAVEATPENTPLPKDKDRVHFKLPTPGSPASTAHLTSPRPPPLSYTRTTSQSFTPPMSPSSSVPPSPAHHTHAHAHAHGSESSGAASGSGPFGGGPLMRRDSIFDSIKKDSVMHQRLQKVVNEQQQGSGSSSTSGSSVGGPPVFKDEGKRLSAISLGEGVPMAAPTEAIPVPVPFNPNSDAGAGGGGPLTPMLGLGGGGGESLTDDSDEHYCSTASGCPLGAGSMPNSQSMMAFAQRVNRIRYHTHCADRNSEGPSPGTSPSTHITLPVPKQVKRANSCPAIVENPNAEKEAVAVAAGAAAGSTTTTPTTTEPDSIDGPGLSKDRPQQQWVQLQPLLQPSQPLLPPSQQQQQQLQPPGEEKLQPYEPFFEGLLPQFLQSPGLSKPELESPHHLLDHCISKAAFLHGKAGDESLEVVKCQVELLHGQLLFERHRRECHALRNRSLAKKCRSFQQREEQTFALKNQLHNAEKEVAAMRAEVQIQREKSKETAKELQQIISELETKVDTYKREINSLKTSKMALESKYAQMHLDHQVMLIERDQHGAQIFQLENEVKYSKKYVEVNAGLKHSLDKAHREILFLGELCRRQEETLSNYNHLQHVEFEMDQMKTAYELEMNELQIAARTNASKAAAALGYINHLQEELEKKDHVVERYKKYLEDAGVEQKQEIKKMDARWEEVKNDNLRLEMEILTLNHQLTVKSYSSRDIVRRTCPHNGESANNSAGNSVGSDVDSATSAGGMHLSPPDKEKDKALLIFGSPEFGSSIGAGMDAQAHAQNVASTAASASTQQSVEPLQPTIRTAAATAAAEKNDNGDGADHEEDAQAQAQAQDK